MALISVGDITELIVRYMLKGYPVDQNAKDAIRVITKEKF